MSAKRKRVDRETGPDCSEGAVGRAGAACPGDEQQQHHGEGGPVEAPNSPKRARRTGRPRRASKVEPASRTDADNGGDDEAAGFPAGFVHPNGFRTNAPPKDRPIRVYADGVFDLFHLGHMRQLEQAKKTFANVTLVVGVTGDRETHRRKGLTVLSGKERADSVRHCKWVDEVVEDCPWVVTVDFLAKHQLDYVAHDDIPYGADEGDDIYGPIKAAGKFLVTQRTDGISTTGIITKIVRDYEQYISRQLKRGTSRKELNISWLKKNEIDIKRQFAEIRDDIRLNWTMMGQELGKDLRQFWLVNRPANGSAAAGRGLRASSADMRKLGGGGRRLAVRRIASTVSEGGSPHPQPLLPASPGSSSSPPADDRMHTTADFITGYTLGLIGGVKSWMSGSKRSLNRSRSGNSAYASSSSSSGEGELHLRAGPDEAMA